MSLSKHGNCTERELLDRTNLQSHVESSATRRISQNECRRRTVDLSYTNVTGGIKDTRVGLSGLAPASGCSE